MTTDRLALEIFRAWLCGQRFGSVDALADLLDAAIRDGRADLVGALATAAGVNATIVAREAA